MEKGLYSVMEERRSIRRYRTEPVPAEAIDRIVRAVQVAPSWKNRQAWHLIVVTRRATIERIGALLGDNPRGLDWATVPVAMLLAMDEQAIDAHDGRAYYLVDAGIAGEHLVLAAQAEGLGTCWIGWFEEAPLHALLGIPDGMRVVMVTPLGYPAEAPSARPRKAPDAFVHREQW